MAVNIELGERVLDQITEHPETHDQNHYCKVNCKTTMCIAGWAAELAGGKWVFDDPAISDHLAAEPDDDPNEVIEAGVVAPVAVIQADDRGRRVLGLSRARAYQIFHDMNKDRAIDKLRRTVRSAKAARTRAARGS